MKASTLKFWLFIVLAFVLTQLGSIAFANWDAPYGFYKDLSVWLGSSAGGLLLVIAYGIYVRKREKLGYANIVLAAVIVVLTAIIGYRAELAIEGEMGYGSGNIVLFVIGGVISFVLSIMLLPVSLPYALTGDLYYPYDRPLAVAWVAMIIAAVPLAAYIKARKEERLMEPGGRGPSVSSSGQGGP